MDERAPVFLIDGYVKIVSADTLAGWTLLKFTDSAVGEMYLGAELFDSLSNPSGTGNTFLENSRCCCG